MIFTINIISNRGQTLTLDIGQLKLRCEIESVQSQGLTPLPSPIQSGFRGPGYLWQLLYKYKDLFL
jgi:hypothetical protein